MKNAILLPMICVFFSANTQDLIVDNAVQGTGNNQHQYVGVWKYNTSSPTFHNSTLSYSNQTGAYVKLTFVGNKVEWGTEKKNTHGIAAVSIDGAAETMIDLYSATAQQQTIVYSSQTLTQGTHTIKIRVTGTKNPASTGFYAIHDYFHISQFVPPPPLPDIGNTRFGELALRNLGYGSHNSAFGYYALPSMYQGGANTAIGSRALFTHDKGSHNTAVGFESLFSGAGGQCLGNTAVGAQAMSVVGDGQLNTAIGFRSGPGVPFLNNTTALGANAITTATDQVRIGNSNVTSIGGQVSWSTLSDGRFKKDIKEDVSGLEFINSLRPVSYTFDKDAVAKFFHSADTKEDAAARRKPVRQTGFVAQEVDALVNKSGYVFSGVEIPQNENDAYTIRYAEFVVPLVKAVQELSAKVEEQQKEIEALRNAGTATKDMLSTAGVMLYQNNPNPFSVDTDIKMVVPESAHQVNIIVYTLEGRQIKDLTVKQRGQAAVTVQGNELNPGMYLYALIVDGRVMDTKRMILTK